MDQDRSHKTEDQIIALSNAMETGTMQHVVETLLGMEIVDEMDQAEDMQALARRQWEKRAKAHNVKEIVNNKK